VKVVARTWLNLTALAPVKLVPVIMTEVPTGPLVGVKDVMVGRGDCVTLKSLELVAVPFAFVTWIGPSVPLLGTVAVILVSLTTVNDAALWLSNSTSFTAGLLKWVPLIVTKVPIGPLVGLNEVIVGAFDCVTLKSLELVAVPSAFVTWIGPSVPLLGTVAVIVLSFTTVNVPALCPSNSTSFATGLLKWVPVIVTKVPIDPLVGLNEVIVGSDACAAVTPIPPTNTVLRATTVVILVTSLLIGPRMGQSPPFDGPWDLTFPP
jgi:hypothetical protein